MQATVAREAPGNAIFFTVYEVSMLCHLNCLTYTFSSHHAEMQLSGVAHCQVKHQQPQHCQATVQSQFSDLPLDI